MPSRLKNTTCTLGLGLLLDLRVIFSVYSLWQATFRASIVDGRIARHVEGKAKTCLFKPDGQRILLAIKIVQKDGKRVSSSCRREALNDDFLNNSSWLAPRMDVLSWGRRDFQISFSNRDTSRNAWNRHWGSFMVDTGILSNNIKFPSHKC